jgi:phospholipase C
MGVEKVKRVVVLMLENRSFDHLLGGVPNVGDASSGNTNTDHDGNVFVQTQRDNFRSPDNLDPKHEFTNVRVQLGPLTQGQFPMSGFVEDALGVVGGGRDFDRLSADEQQAVQSVMDYFSNDALPALHALAREFMVCDRWFASVPGPTWPNRFFAMMGSCHGQLEMPTGALNAVVAVRAIAAQLGKDSIFSALTGVSHKIYSDYLVPLSILLKGSGGRSSIADFEHDVDAGALPQFSWIEPDYSNLLDRANSQHAPEDVRRADNLVARIYNKLRGNPAIWQETLLVILHDEHGGYYDHVPPAPTCAADDSPSHPAFSYSYTGVRVPCVLVSPWLQRGVFSDDCEHTSLLAFLCDQFALPQQRALLGRRTQAAGHFGTVSAVWSDVLRTDVPASVPTTALAQSVGEEVSADLDDLQAKLLSALHALAGDQAASTAMFDHTVGPATTAAENPDARIAQAWEQGGTLDKDTVAQMVDDVKKAFTTAPPRSPAAPAKAARARKSPTPRKPAKNG